MEKCFSCASVATLISYKNHRKVLFLLWSVDAIADGQKYVNSVPT